LLSAAVQDCAGGAVQIFGIYLQHGLYWESRSCGSNLGRLYAAHSVQFSTKVKVNLEYLDYIIVRSKA